MLSPRKIGATGKAVIAMLFSATQRKHMRRRLNASNENFLLDAPAPWLTFDAVDFIMDRLAPRPAVFEWGSGGSTLFWLERGAQCISVEHDPIWHAKLLNRLGGATGIDYRLVPPETLSEPAAMDYSDPTNFSSKSMPKCRFQQYVCQIDEFPDHSFDAVLIDGRARPSCLYRSLSKVKRGGLLILDNAERNYYLDKTLVLLTAFQKNEFYGYGPLLSAPWRTDVYIPAV